MGIEKIGKSAIETLAGSVKKTSTAAIKEVAEKVGKKSLKLKPQAISDEFINSALEDTLNKMISKNNKPALSISEFASKLSKK